MTAGVAFAQPWRSSAAAGKTPSFTSLDTTQTSCTHPADPLWTHAFRHGVADALADLRPKRAERIRRCGEAAVRMVCAGCGASHIFPERCAARTCPVCARRSAASIAERLNERIQIHDLIMESEPWDGPGESPRTAYGDRHGRSWRLITLTTPALENEADRFDPERLRQDVRADREALLRFWRSTPWGRQVRDPGSRKKRVRHDTSAVAGLEVAPGGMVHMHLLVYGEYVPQAILAEEWGRALGLDGPAVVDVRSVNPGDVAGGIRETLKYATKGEGSGRDQARRAAAVEYALADTKRISIIGALRSVKGRSEVADSEDAKPEDLHADHDAACQACGTMGEWKWAGRAPPWAVRANDGWGAVLAPCLPS